MPKYDLARDENMKESHSRYPIN